ncbi:unnamed protein product [Victoria cruziana]
MGQPGPRDSMVQCYIKKNRTSHTYRLYLGLSQNIGDMSKGSGTYIGKLRIGVGRNWLYMTFQREVCRGMHHLSCIRCRKPSSCLISKLNT